MSQPFSRHPNFPVPYGTQRRAKGWRQEGILRLLENVLSVGEDPENLVIYAALGKAARNWASHDKIVQTLRTMGEDETLVIQSGKPIRRPQDARQGAARHHGELQHRRPVG